MSRRNEKNIGGRDCRNARCPWPECEKPNSQNLLLTQKLNPLDLPAPLRHALHRFQPQHVVFEHLVNRPSPLSFSASAGHRFCWSRHTRQDNEFCRPHASAFFLPTSRLASSNVCVSTFFRDLVFLKLFGPVLFRLAGPPSRVEILHDSFCPGPSSLHGVPVSRPAASAFICASPPEGRRSNSS